MSRLGFYYSYRTDRDSSKKLVLCAEAAVVYVSARTEYAVRAMVAIAGDEAGVLTAARLAEVQGMSYRYLQSILQDLRRAGLLVAHRGTDGGYALARPAAKISVGDVLRAVNGTITTVRGLPVKYASQESLNKVWLSVSRAIEEVVDAASVADLLDSPH